MSMNVDIYFEINNDTEEGSVVETGIIEVRTIERTYWSQRPSWNGDWSNNDSSKLG